MKWKEVEKYKNEYVLFWRDKVVGHSPNLKEILQDAKKYPTEDAIIRKSLSGHINLF
jgi:hypothetical protein